MLDSGHTRVRVPVVLLHELLEAHGAVAMMWEVNVTLVVATSPDRLQFATQFA